MSEPSRDAVARLADNLPAVTPARVFQGRVGASYRTATMLALRADHAAARDAVEASLDLAVPAFAPLLADGLFELATRATSHPEYLRRPDLGRRLSARSRELLAERGDRGRDVQIVVGDGLSAAAVTTQVPVLLPALARACRQRGWSLGRPFVVRHCRVGVMNDVGEILDPRVVVMLIGERPGLATAEALSAYLAYRPRPGDTDARRNLVASIHRNGLPAGAATERIVRLVATILAAEASGTAISEPEPDPALAPPPADQR
jgi:ethanolamine ammonia-lyase small subunit